MSDFLSVFLCIVQKLLELLLLEIFLVLLGLLCLAKEGSRLLLDGVGTLLFRAGLDRRGEV